MAYVSQIQLPNNIVVSIKDVRISSSDITSWNGKEDASNKVTSLSSSSTDTQYPSAKCVYDIIGDVETLINAL